MIQVYLPSNTNFDNNGDMVLYPTSCILHFEINAEWSLNMIHPNDERCSFIQDQSVIKVPSPYGDLLYRVSNIDKGMYDTQIIAYPIFFDVKGSGILWDKRVVNKTGQDALNSILDGSGFTGESDIKKANTCYFQQMNRLEAISSGDDNTFINRWGGEMLYINKHIIINERIGSDNGARASYRYNLTDISAKTDFKNVVTRIYPKAYNGHLLPDGESIDSPNINKYPIVYPQIIEFSNIKLKEDAQDGDEENGYILCNDLNELYDTLREASVEEYRKGIDIPEIVYDVNIADLSKLDEYKEFTDLVQLQLGDTVHVEHEGLGIETNQRVVSMEYDCILECIDTMTLGSDVSTYFDNVNKVTSTFNKVVDTSTNTLIAEKVQGILNAAKANLRAQKDIAQKQDVRAMLFEDLDPNSPTFGAMCGGTQGIQISKKRNPENTDWVWGTAITFESVIADYIITGILSDKEGKFYLNLDTGELVMKDAYFSGTVQGSVIKGSEINGGTITGSNIKGGNINVDTDVHVGNRIYLNNTKGIQSGIHLGEDGNKPRVIFNDDGNVKGVSFFSGTTNDPMIHIGTDVSMLNFKNLLITIDDEVPYTGTQVAKSFIRVKNGFVMEIK